jgi:hypothetical protein
MNGDYYGNAFNCVLFQVVSCNDWSHCHWDMSPLRKSPFVKH